MQALPDELRFYCVRDMLGLKLSDVVSGRMRWVFISNYMVDLQWLLSAAPDLADADRLMIAHGWRRPVRSTSDHLFVWT